eukprot:133659_1
MSSILNKIDSIIEYINMAEQQDENLTLGYWKICGLANTARMLLAAANIKYKNVMYEQKGADQNYSRAEWYDVKFKVGLDFPNLPYLIDGKRGVTMTESRAIYRYISRTFKIGVQTDPELAIADMCCGVISDAMSSFTGLCYRTYPDGKDKYLKEQLPPKMKQIESFLKNKKYLTGNQISY